MALGTWVLEKIETTFDSRAFRRAVGQFVTGVTVIAIELDGEIRPMTANSFTSLSLEPPLVLLLSVGRAAEANPFYASEPPPFGFTAWSVVWVLIVLGIGIALFRRREL